MSQKAEDILLRDYQERPTDPKDKEEEAPPSSLEEIVTQKPKTKLVREFFRETLVKLGNLESAEFE